MNKHLLTVDFDGTTARTFDDSPRGMSVGLASRRAIGEIFGGSGDRAYTYMGGLENREPGELVRLLCKRLGRSAEGTEELIEYYVQRKLSYLLPEISPEWPTLNLGAKEFFQDVSAGVLPVDLAIVSSGHDSFISRVFEVNGIPPPSIIVTSDILRERRVVGKHKPNPYQLAEAHRQWLKKRLNGELMSLGIASGFTERGQYKANMAYVGDDPVKDGGLAEASRIPFIFLPDLPFAAKFRTHKDKGQIKVRDFFELKRILLRHVEGLGLGVSFAEILFGKKDAEIFPPVPEDERPWARMMRERSLI